MSTLTEEQIEKCVDELKHIRAQEDAVLNRLRTKGAVTDEQITKGATVTPNSTDKDYVKPATGAVTEQVFERYIDALECRVGGRQELIRDLRDMRIKGVLTIEQFEKVADTLCNNQPLHGTSDVELRATLMEQARKDLVEYARGGSDNGEWHWPNIIPRSEAIRRLQKRFAQELIDPVAGGFVFKGFKGLNNMTNKELAKELSSDSSLPDCIVWYDLDFQLLFGNRYQATKIALRERGLVSSSLDALAEEEDFEDDEEDGDERERGL